MPVTKVVLKSGVHRAIAVKPFKEKGAMLDVLVRIQQAGLECIGTMGETNIDAFLNATNILSSVSHYD